MTETSKNKSYRGIFTSFLGAIDWNVRSFLRDKLACSGRFAGPFAKSRTCGRESWYSLYENI